MNSDATSLDHLRDIAEPVAVSWWPPAVGWWVLLGAALIGVAIYTIDAIRDWRSNVYRRIAIKEVEAAVDSAAISQVLKRTALVAFPRTEVARLSGARWCQWLADTSGLSLTREISECLTTGVFRSQRSDGESELRPFAIAWIKRHGRPLEQRDGSA
ncbi:DUF4381 domain-containing protein [Stieleria sp. ICT_E10.1]|uniref:DUF4381 domain-containing protein n=1 Tax=Stieleria sedimenti TaxID=2976331 RepID=UPI0021800667|nr:DUF4381 domain-containing protein [Stieleria sedimenti]MCS7467359.1 DUF4381 domain-containing protein [Stieleria sedimenti]